MVRLRVKPPTQGLPSRLKTKPGSLTNFSRLTVRPPRRRLELDLDCQSRNGLSKCTEDECAWSQFRGPDQPFSSHFLARVTSRKHIMSKRSTWASSY